MLPAGFLQVRHAHLEAPYYASVGYAQPAVSQLGGKDRIPHLAHSSFLFAAHLQHGGICQYNHVATACQNSYSPQGGT